LARFNRRAGGIVGRGRFGLLPLAHLEFSKNKQKPMHPGLLVTFVKSIIGARRRIWRYGTLWFDFKFWGIAAVTRLF
jgi:hypothetical protein